MPDRAASMYMSAARLCASATRRSTSRVVSSMRWERLSTDRSTSTLRATSTSHWADSSSSSTWSTLSSRSARARSESVTWANPGIAPMANTTVTARARRGKCFIGR